MQIDAETHGACVVVRVEGTRIDAGTAMQFKDEMRRVLTDTPDRVVLDLGAVDSIDSSGLGAIVSVMKNLGTERRLELAALSPKVLAVFRLTRMDAVIIIHDSVDDAVALVDQAS